MEYRLEVDFSFDAVVAPAPPAWPLLPATGPGWYKGDLHGHTLHSDGKWDVPDFVAHARARGLDFVTLTDHNTVSGLAQIDRLASAGLLTMGGIELTTHYGHCLALGTRQWLEWRANSHAGVTMPAIAANVTNHGALFVIAHPMAPGDPGCTGCRWEYPEMRPGNASLIEIWNSPWSDYNEEGLAAFCQWAGSAWRDERRRLVMTGGSDIHGPARSPGRFWLQPCLRRRPNRNRDTGGRGGGAQLHFQRAVIAAGM